MLPSGWRSLRISGLAGRIAILACFGSSLPAMAADQPAASEGHPPPVFVTGRVMTDDGLPFSGPVIVELVCDRAPYAEGYAGAKGDFGFHLGDSNSSVPQDATTRWKTDYFAAHDVPANPAGGGVPESVTPPKLASVNCEMRAVLAGYRSESVPISSLTDLDYLNVGTIVLHRMGGTDGHAVSVTSLAAPKGARAAFDKGQEALKKANLDEAQKNFEKAGRIYPGFAAAWFELGKLAGEQGRFDDALRFFQAAIRCDPKYVEPYLSVAAIEYLEQQWPQLAETTGALLGLDPYDYPQAYYMSAMASYALKNVDAAEKSAREAERLDTQGRFPAIRRLLGVILAERRAFPEAAGQVREYLKFAPQAPDAATARVALARLEALSGEAPLDR